ncbi:unnamed protein product [Amoebophrya sp. A25]|nr:unnamed protein product [Amoebophrya sp. A25]|eukprot:GSA25T00006137001.1
MGLAIVWLLCGIWYGVFFHYCYRRRGRTHVLRAMAEAEVVAMSSRLGQQPRITMDEVEPSKSTESVEMNVKSKVAPMYEFFRLQEQMNLKLLKMRLMIDEEGTTSRSSSPLVMLKPMPREEELLPNYVLCFRVFFMLNTAESGECLQEQVKEFRSAYKRVQKSDFFSIPEKTPKRPEGDKSEGHFDNTNKESDVALYDEHEKKTNKPDRAPAGGKGRQQQEEAAFRGREQEQ